MLRTPLVLALATLAGMAQTRDLIIDTDPGVDDALAISLALRSPELNVRAITVVAGNVPLEVGLKNALRLVELGGRPGVPVHAGAVKPLFRKLTTAYYAHGDNGLAGVAFPEPTVAAAPEPAVDAIRRIVKSNPGNVSIVALGPLTNLATVLRAEPSIARLIRQIVFMGGAISGGNVTPSAEFNIFVDPEAARIVFHSGIPLTMVGLDVTTKVILDEVRARRLEQAPNAVVAARLATATIERYRARGRDGMAMHDPLAMAVFLDPSIVRTKRYFVDVETSGEITAGETVVYTRAPVRRSAPPDGAPFTETVSETLTPNMDVAIEVEPERFFNLFLTRLTR